MLVQYKFVWGGATGAGLLGSSPSLASHASLPSKARGWCETNPALVSGELPCVLCEVVVSRQCDVIVNSHRLCKLTKGVQILRRACYI